MEKLEIWTRENRGEVWIREIAKRVADLGNLATLWQGIIFSTIRLTHNCHWIVSQSDCFGVNNWKKLWKKHFPNILQCSALLNNYSWVNSYNYRIAILHPHLTIVYHCAFYCVCFIFTFLPIETNKSWFAIWP